MIKMNFYFPLSAKYFGDSGYDDYDEGYDEYEGFDMSSGELKGYKSIIEEKLESYQIDDGKGMEQYFDEDDNAEVAARLKSIHWGFEVFNRELFGKVEVELTEPISQEGVKALKDWITGQNSDGLGEGFEQQDIQTGNGYLNVSFWHYGKGYYVDTEEEFFKRTGQTPQKTEAEKIADNRPSFKPKCALIGEDGNIFNLMGIASRTLKQNGMPEKANEMFTRITEGAQSYYEALAIIGEYVEITDGSEDEGESFEPSM